MQGKRKHSSKHYAIVDLSHNEQMFKRIKTKQELPPFESKVWTTVNIY